MSTTETLTSDDDVAGMVEDLKKWPSTAVDNGEYELAVMPFITFYFTYAPAHYLATSLAMIEVHEAFERLAGKPYKIATHPDSERPHPYGSKRLGDLREWARKTRIDKSFLFNFTDQENHCSSPSTSGYFWRNADRENGSTDYSSIQLYYRWQWWLDNKDAWRRFVHETIERLRPEQVYSGFSVANPLAFGCRAEVTVWDRALAPHFYGLDTDYPFGMKRTPQLPSGLRPPTWGFFLSDTWRERLSIEREAVRTFLNDPRIRIDGLGCGQWIELGPQPELYPVEQGVPVMPARLNRMLRPLRHPNLDLGGFGEWDGDPNERFNLADTRRWLARFDDDGDWPTPQARGRTPGAPPNEPAPSHIAAGETVPRAGWWFTPAKRGSRRYFEAGEIAPKMPTEPARGIVVWQWDTDQRMPLPEPARMADTGQPAPRAGHWQRAGDSAVRCVAALSEPLPAYRGNPVRWVWQGETTQGARVRSGQPCPYPGVWACEQIPTGPEVFKYQAPMPQVAGRDVTWTMVRFLR
ncbi:type VI immunity family protein [Cupriavidus sp. 30B13]|uniref:type VI immunity family protein n=1 Tax=Cupriavidus sp. 30B13 TaxID=3384241 RepID=UPI003B8EE039